MSATMARRGGWVQLEQSDMRLAWIMAQIAKEWFLRAKIEETQYLIKKLHAKIWEEKKWGVQYPGHRVVKAAIQIHMDMLCQNLTAGCLSYQNGTAENPQACWRRKETGAPPPDQCSQPTGEATPPLPGMASAPTGNKSKVQSPEINNLPARYVYSHTSPRCAVFFALDTYAQDSMHDTDIDSDMLADHGISTS